MSYTITQLSAGPTSISTPVFATSSDGSIIVVAKNNDFIYLSTDSGATWTTALNTALDWQSVTISGNGQKMAACVYNGNIWVSTDSGANWTENVVSGYPNAFWQSIKYTRDGSKLIAGERYIHESTDDGATWTRIFTTNTFNDCTSLAISDNGLNIIGLFGGAGAYIGTYSGSWSWTPYSPGGGPIQAAMSGDGTKLAFTVAGNVLQYSLDSGSNWSTALATINPWGIAISQDGTRFTAWAIGTYIGLHTTTDPAGSWTYSADTNTGFYNNGITGSATLSKVYVGSGSSYLRIATLGAGPEPVICFREGTSITTFNPIAGREESTAVENVRPGMLVKTRTSGYVPVCIVGTSTVTIPNHAERTAERLYVCTKEQFPELTDDLYITGHHSILVNSLTDAEREETAADLGRVYVTEGKYRLPAHIDRRARVYEAPGAVERIWHFALDHNDEQMNYGVYANGLLVESCSIWRLRTMIGYTLIGANTAAIENSASYERVRGAEAMMVGC